MSEIENRFKIPKRFLFGQRDVWEEYAALAAKYDCLNLSNGFPDFLPMDEIAKILEDVGQQDTLVHQYTRDYGHPRLINILSKVYSNLFGRKINPQTEILTTVGAYEALFCTIIGHVDKGDEVVIIEPFYDCYEPMVRIAGGIPKFISLRLDDFKRDIPISNDWILDKKELENLFNSKTKILILNNPHNPLGKIYQLEELEYIADLCKKWNVLCVSDEVFEWIVYKPNKHIRMATLPGMWERTITIGSAGKTFSVTGWRIGWVYGPSNLLHNLQMVHQNSVYTGNTPMQEVVARCFENELPKLNNDMSYFNLLTNELIEKRNYIVKCLTDIGIKPTVPGGGYFIIADWSSLESLLDLSSEKDKWKDYKFTKWMIKNVGLQAIPLTAFYSEDHKNNGENFVRFCFFKKNKTLFEAAKILENLKSKLNE